MINFLKKPGPFGWPMYAWIGGVGAMLIAGYIFFKNRNTSGSTNVTANVPGQNTASPMSGLTYPYPYAGAAGAAVNGVAPPAPIGGVYPSGPGMAGNPDGGGVIGFPGANYLSPSPRARGLLGLGNPGPGVPRDPYLLPVQGIGAFSGGSQIPATYPGGFFLGASPQPIANPTAVQTQGTVLGGAPSRMFSPMSAPPPSVPSQPFFGY